MKTFLRLKKLLGEPDHMYLVPLKHGDRWGLRKRPEKDVNSLKDYFSHVSEHTNTKMPTLKPVISSPKKKGMIGSIYLKAVVGDDDELDEQESQCEEVTTFTYRNGQLVQTTKTDENGRKICEYFHDDKGLYKCDYDEKGKVIKKTFYDENYQECGFIVFGPKSD